MFIPLHLQILLHLSWVLFSTPSVQNINTKVKKLNQLERGKSMAIIKTQQRQKKCEVILDAGETKATPRTWCLKMTIDVIY